MIDAIITGARIFDGVSATPFETDLAIVADRIALIGDLSGRDAREHIDARGRTLSPGFIDVHSHSDELWLADGRCEGKIRQGVTTEIAGNCGTSVAPLRGASERHKAEEAAAVGVEIAWRDLDEFFDLVERGGVALNVASLIGLGTTRRAVCGDRTDVLDDAELAAECALVRESVERGALGVSSGLIYVPSRYADDRELVACVSAARDAGMPRYASHIRSEGDDLIAAVDECACDRSRRGRGRSTLAPQGRREEELGESPPVARCDRPALARGVSSPRPTCIRTSRCGPTSTRSCRRTRSWAAARRRSSECAIPRRRSRSRCACNSNVRTNGTTSRSRPSRANGTHRSRVCGSTTSPRRGVFRRRVLRCGCCSKSGSRLQAIFFAMCEDDVASVLSAGFVSIGSDASARSDRGPTAQGLPHPRTFGTFPRVFGRYVRGRHTLDIGEAIRRMTSLAADQFGIAERGRIERGAFADLVLFDAERIVDTATYEAPYAYPIGIDDVWVNGRAVVRDGSPTGARPGRALRGGRARA